MTNLINQFEVLAGSPGGALIALLMLWLTLVGIAVLAYRAVKSVWLVTGPKVSEVWNGLCGHSVSETNDTMMGDFPDISDEEIVADHLVASRFKELADLAEEHSSELSGLEDVARYSRARKETLVKLDEAMEQARNRHMTRTPGSNWQ